MTTKKCTKCKIEQHLYDFTKDSRTKDGRRAYCKRCQSLYNISVGAKYRARLTTEDRRRYEKNYRAKNTYKEKHRQDSKKHRLKYPIKAKARDATSYLPKQCCSVCGLPKAEKHHEDYNEPFKVTWLCFKHHRELHCAI